MDQKRLLLAFVLSAVILFGWSYLFPPTATDPQNANTSQPSSNAPATPAPTSAPAQLSQNTLQTPPINPASPDTTPQRILKVSTPLYEIQLDSLGAVAKSWVIKRNKEKNGEGKPLRSGASTKDNPQPLELISQEGLNRGLAPLKILTGRPDLDAAIAARNYAVVGRAHV